MSTNWKITGQYFESCNCDLVCPCIFLAPPTEGFCEAFVGWHIEDGHLDGVQLNDLKVSAWLHSPGSLTDGNWKLALYIDERANEAQKDAIVALWSGDHGGHLAVIAGLVGEIMSVKQVPIEFTQEGRTHYLKVGEFGSNTMQELEGEDGGKVVVSNHPLAVSPSEPVTISKSVAAIYKDNGYDWHQSEKVGLSAPFTYAA
jgi:hypothetical protein